MNNKDQVFNALRGRGLTLAAVTGIMANIRKESNYNPKAKGDGDTSFGLCQWHNKRWTSLKNFCTVSGLDVNTIPAQIDFLLYEMEKSYATVYNAIVNAPDSVLGAGEVAYIMCKKYEIPANAEQSAQARKKLAYTLYDEYKGTASAPSGYSGPYINYVVKKGDSVSELAEAYDCSVSDIISINPGITNPDLIRVGDIIRIPETEKSVEATEKDKLTRIRDGLQGIAATIEKLLGEF